jgi:hypothetical protein
MPPVKAPQGVQYIGRWPGPFEIGPWLSPRTARPAAPSLRATRTRLADVQICKKEFQLSTANIISSEWGSDRAYYIQFSLRRGGSRWYRFTGAAADAAAGGADPASLSGTECAGPPLDFIKRAESFGQSAAEVAGEAAADVGEVAGLL